MNFRVHCNNGAILDVRVNEPLYLGDVHPITLQIDKRLVENGARVKSSGTFVLTFREESDWDDIPVMKVLQDCFDHIERRVVPKLKAVFRENLSPEATLAVVWCARCRCTVIRAAPGCLRALGVIANFHQSRHGVLHGFKPVRHVRANSKFALLLSGVPSDFFGARARHGCRSRAVSRTPFSGKQPGCEERPDQRTINALGFGDPI